MKTKVFYIFQLLSCFLLVWACEPDKEGNSAIDSQGKAPLSDAFQISKVTKSLSYAVLKDGSYVREEGYLKEDKKHGFWISYYPNRRKIERLAHYRNGRLDGPYNEYSLTGRMTKDATYDMGVLEGDYFEYKFNEPLISAHYEKGKLEGEYKIYFQDSDNRGILQQIIRYKDGKKHGTMEYFNPDGKVVLSYEYENDTRK